MSVTEAKVLANILAGYARDNRNYYRMKRMTPSGEAKFHMAVNLHAQITQTLKTEGDDLGKEAQLILPKGMA